VEQGLQGTTGGGTLFGIVLVLYIYFAPAMVAFIRAHPRFWIILGLNAVLGPVQSIAFQSFLPIAPDALSTNDVIRIGLLVLLGPGWLALMAWAGYAPVTAPNARLQAWRDTKTFDFVAALPLITWFVNGAMMMRPNLARTGNAILAGEGEAITYLLFFSLLFSALFCLLSVYLLVIRDKPVLRTQGIFPRIAAITGTFLGVGMLRLPVADLSLPLQALAFLLTGLGSAASAAVLWRLGKSFSIMPEARTLVTTGPYNYIRHPLYAAEIITVFGMILQYQQPWSLAMGGGVILFQVIRSLYEERILTQAFPDYVSYKARTKRFIPGVI
jgi:protein-S-isoprenylcysteine O-methyltransferase Ste14